MSNKLVKDTALQQDGFTYTVSPGTSPTPAYCIDVALTTTGFTVQYVTVPPDPHIPGSGGTYTILVGPTTTTTIEHECFPGTAGSPGTVSATPNYTVTRNVGWNGGAISIGTLTADGQFKFSARADSVGIVAGLSDVNPDAGYLSIRWGLYCRTGLFTVIESGVEQTVAAGYTGTDVFAVVRTGAQVAYWKNSTLVHVSTDPSSGIVFADASLYMGGDEIDNASLSSTVDVALAPSSGSVAGTLGQLQPFAVSGLASYVSVQGVLGQLVGDARATNTTATCAGTLGQLRGESYTADVGVVCAGVLGQLVGYAESGLLMPAFAGSDATLQSVQGFGISLAGALGAVSLGVLGGLRGFAANAPNIAGVVLGNPLPPASDPTGGIDANGDWTGRGGGQLRMLVGFSYDSVVAARSRMGGQVVLPHPLQVQGRILAGNTIDVDIVLPHPLVVDGSLGWSADLELPFLEVDAAGTIDNVVSADLTLPPITVAATALAGTVANAALTLPLITVAAVPSWYGSRDLTLPFLTVDGRISTDLAIAVDLRLPLLTVAGAISATYGVANAHLVLPMLVMASGSVAGLTLPLLRVAGSIVQGSSQQTRLAYAVNLSHGALTTFSNFPFKQFARAYNRYFAVGLDGDLFLFGGDRDVTSVIDWEWRSGLADFGSPGMKGVLGVYLDGEIESGADLILVTDDAERTYGHRAKGAYNTHKPHRIATGRGIRSRSLAFGMKSSVGGYLELDSITPEYVITPRNI